MSEAVYQIAERAIAERLIVAGRFRTPLGGPSFEYVNGIRLGNILLRNADCPTTHSDVEITTDEFASLCDMGRHFYRKVGMWDFAPADDPAADLIAHAHRNPAAVGRALYEARKRIEQLEGGQ